MKLYKQRWVIFMWILGTLIAQSIFASGVYASTSDGTIDATSRYAWTENAGWIDFGTSGGAVHVTDGELSGYAFGENIGWISLNCSNTSTCGTVSYKVLNNSEGVLSGYAWSENVGWIHFAPSSGGVTINSSGDFAGYAYGENIGWIVFNCSTTSSCGTVSYKVNTDWRPASTRGGGSTASQSSGGGPTGYGGYSSPYANFVSPTNPPPITPVVPAPRPTITPTTWPRFLSLRMTGDDVLRLQQFLNKQGYRIAVKGPGSPGKETKLFGMLTYRALMKWQQDHKLPATGYFGPQTLALMMTLEL